MECSRLLAGLREFCSLLDRRAVELSRAMALFRKCALILVPRQIRIRLRAGVLGSRGAVRHVGKQTFDILRFTATSASIAASCRPVDVSRELPNWFALATGTASFPRSGIDRERCRDLGRCSEWCVGPYRSRNASTTMPSARGLDPTSCGKEAHHRPRGGGGRAASL
jgi:hypothetical protein